VFKLQFLKKKEAEIEANADIILLLCVWS